MSTYISIGNIYQSPMSKFVNLQQLAFDDFHISPWHSHQQNWKTRLLGSWIKDHEHVMLCNCTSMWCHNLSERCICINHMIMIYHIFINISKAKDCFIIRTKLLLNRNILAFHVLTVIEKWWHFLNGSQQLWHWR